MHIQGDGVEMDMDNALSKPIVGGHDHCAVQLQGKGGAQCDEQHDGGRNGCDGQDEKFVLSKAITMNKSWPAGYWMLVNKLELYQMAFFGDIFRGRNLNMSSYQKIKTLNPCWKILEGNHT